jgi:CRP-like cAMP-binding protein
MIDPVVALARVPLLSGIKKRELGRLASSMQERRFPAGSTAMVEGESGIGFFLIVEGEASVTVGDQEVRRLGPGDFFGEMALVTGDARSATVTAESDLDCLGLTAWTFRPWAREHPDVLWSMLETVVRRLAEAEAR